MTPSKATGRRQFTIDSRVKLDPEDLDRFCSIGRAVYVSAGYAWISSKETGPISVHSIVMDRIRAGQGGLRIDHINGDKLDNRRANLRLVPDQINQINRKRLNQNNKSGYRGVSFMPSTGKYRATITVDYRQVHLGSFITAEDAFAARRSAEAVHYPEPCPLPETEAS